MKHGLPLFLLIFLSLSCIPEQVGEPEPDCIVSEELYPPVGYELIELARINFFGDLINFQFLNDSLGFALLNLPHESTKIYKTTDGGKTWICPHEDFESFAYDLCFVNEDTGVVSVSQDKIFVTNDGGLSWTSKDLQNLEGSFYKLSCNNEGLIIGLLRNPGESISVCKSEDEGNTWEVIYDDQESDIKLDFGFFKVNDDLVIISNREGEVIRINFEGEIVSRIPTPHLFIKDVYFLDDNSIVVAYLNRIVKSENGGETWYNLLSRSNQIINLEAGSEGLVLSGSEHCTVPSIAGLFITTTSNGEQWVEHSNLTDFLLFDFQGAHKTYSGSYYVFVDKKQYELKKL